MAKVLPSEVNHAAHHEAARPARLRAVSRDELAHILTAHRLYLETERKQGKRGDLGAADLTGFDPSGEALRRIRLDHAILRNVSLARADLQRANLIGADLRGACLTGTDLGAARMSGANLEAANLDGAV